MLVLLLFNDLADGEYLSFDEIQERTNISPFDLSRILHTLAVLPKARVLTKQPPNKEPPKPGDKFYFNAQFHSKAMRIKAPVISGVATNKVEGDEERKETEEKNAEHRRPVIDTSIVRIMKARKECTHQQLISEIITQLASRFKPDLDMVKRRIDALIDQEYMERIDSAKVPTYKYLA
jgi:cullin 3